MRGSPGFQSGLWYETMSKNESPKKKLSVKIPVIFSVKTGEFCILANSWQKYHESRRDAIKVFTTETEEPYKLGSVRVILPTYEEQKDRNRLLLNYLSPTEGYRILIDLGTYSSEGEFLLDDPEFRDMEDEEKKLMIETNLLIWDSYDKDKQMELLTMWGLFE